MRLKPLSPGRRWILALTCAGVLVLAVLAPVVWVWDIIRPEVRVLAEVRLPSNGGSLRLEQYWNHIDFYTIELLHFRTDGTRTTLVVDGDAAKQWFCRASIEETSSVVRFENSFGPVARYNWASGMLLR